MHQHRSSSTRASGDIPEFKNRAPHHEPVETQEEASRQPDAVRDDQASIEEGLADDMHHPAANHQSANMAISSDYAGKTPTPDEFAEKNAVAQRMAITPTVAVEHDVSTLPDEVKKNLVGYDKMQTDQLLLRILAKPGAVYTVDKIVMVLWYEHKKTIERSEIQRRLRALVALGAVTKEPRLRGIFSITPEGMTFLGM